MRRVPLRTTSLTCTSSTPPPSGREAITIGDKRRLKAEYIVNIDVVFYFSWVYGREACII